MGRATSALKQLTLDGVDYIAVPKAEFERFARIKKDAKGFHLERGAFVRKKDETTTGGAVEAVPFMLKAIGEDLRAAREHAGLTQAQLAKKLGKTQPMVSGAETGSVRVGERYIAAVLKACGLPEDWKAPRPKKTRRVVTR